MTNDYTISKKMQAVDLEAAAKHLFERWRLWQIALGWSIGPDDSKLKMHPYLQPSWEKLDPEGQRWFMIWAGLAYDAWHDNLDKKFEEQFEEAKPRGEQQQLLHSIMKDLAKGDNPEAESKLHILAMHKDYMDVAHQAMADLDNGVEILSSMVEK